jgi:hypothetical protein
MQEGQLALLAMSINQRIAELYMCARRDQSVRLEPLYEAG